MKPGCACLQMQANNAAAELFRAGKREPPMKLRRTKPVAIDKPHVCAVAGQWYCHKLGMPHSGWGASPVEAYRNWYWLGAFDRSAKLEGPRDDKKGARRKLCQ
jgi:hypothetical protein